MSTVSTTSHVQVDMISFSSGRTITQVYVSINHGDVMINHQRKTNGTLELLGTTARKLFTALCYWIANVGLLFFTTKNENFRKRIEIFDGQIIVPSKFTVRQDLRNMFKPQEVAMKEDCKHMSRRLGMTTNKWPSRVYKVYMLLIIH